jgi:nucleotide-binding universal stress UspA family protein
VVAPIVNPVEMTTWPYPIPAYPPDAAATEQVVEASRQYFLQLREAVDRTGRLAEAAGVVVDVSAASAIMSAAERHSTDGIVMTTHGRGASRLLWGGVVDKVMRGTTLPMLVVRPARIQARREEEGGKCSDD